MKMDKNFVIDSIIFLVEIIRILIYQNLLVHPFSIRNCFQYTMNEITSVSHARTTRIFLSHVISVNVYS